MGEAIEVPSVQSGKLLNFMSIPPTEKNMSIYIMRALSTDASR